MDLPFPWAWSLGRRQTHRWCFDLFGQLRLIPGLGLWSQVNICDKVSALRRIMHTAEEQEKEQEQEQEQEQPISCTSARANSSLARRALSFFLRAAATSCSGVGSIATSSRSTSSAGSKGAATRAPR